MSPGHADPVGVDLVTNGPFIFPQGRGQLGSGYKWCTHARETRKRSVTVAETGGITTITGRMSFCVCIRMVEVSLMMAATATASAACAAASIQGRRCRRCCKAMIIAWNRCRKTGGYMIVVVVVMMVVQASFIIVSVILTIMSAGFCWTVIGSVRMMIWIGIMARTKRRITIIIDLIFVIIRRRWSSQGMLWTRHDRLVRVPVVVAGYIAATAAGIVCAVRISLWRGICRMLIHFSLTTSSGEPCQEKIS